MNTPAIVGVADSDKPVAKDEIQSKPRRPFWHYLIAVKIVLVGIVTIVSGFYVAWLIASDLWAF